MTKQRDKTERELIDAIDAAQVGIEEALNTGAYSEVPGLREEVSHLGQKLAELQAAQGKAARDAREGQRRELQAEAIRLRRQAGDLDAEVAELKKDRTQYEGSPVLNQPGQTSGERVRADSDLARKDREANALRRDAAQLDSKAEAMRK